MPRAVPKGKLKRLRNAATMATMRAQEARSWRPHATKISESGNEKTQFEPDEAEEGMAEPFIGKGRTSPGAVTERAEVVGHESVRERLIWQFRRRGRGLHRLPRQRSERGFCRRSLQPEKRSRGLGGW